MTGYKGGPFTEAIKLDEHCQQVCPFPPIMKLLGPRGVAFKGFKGADEFVSVEISSGYFSRQRKFEKPDVK